METIEYKGYTIEFNLTGWITILGLRGQKFDSLKGAKNYINSKSKGNY